MRAALQRLLTSALACVLVLCAGRAAAEDRDALTRAHHATGTSYYENARYGDALREFDEAYRISSRPAFLYNISVCQEKLGRIDDALASIERYLHESPGPDSQGAAV